MLYLLHPADIHRHIHTVSHDKRMHMSADNHHWIHKILATLQNVREKKEEGDRKRDAHTYKKRNSNYSPLFGSISIFTSLANRIRTNEKR